MIKVSVIVPVYNAEKYIDRCIDSIINQTLKDIEIILINDGSKDNSLSICKKYAEKDIRIKIIDKLNEGASAARNIGIDEARGEYISFIDSDDWIEYNMLENLYYKSKESNTEVIISNYFRNYDHKELVYDIGINKNILNKEEIKNLVIFPLINKENFTSNYDISGFRAPWGRLFKTKTIKDNGIQFKKDLIVGEDLLFNLEILSNVNNIYIDKRPYYHYFNNINSIMTSYKLDCWNIYKKLIDDVNKFLLLNNYMDEIGDRFLIMKLNYITQSIYNECMSTNNKTIFNKLKCINNICKDKIVKDIIQEINYSKLDFKRKFGLNLIRYKITLILYYYYKYINIKNKKVFG